MPKNKKESSSSSDSDSGPEDRNPPPSKKTKPAANETKSSEKTKSVDSNKKQWTLEKLRMVNINEFRGRKMVDIREFYEKNGEILPGKKGISLSISQWKTLVSYVDEITAAVEN